MIPSFTVVVPTWNRPDSVAACLRSLSALQYPADRFEVIVVNDGGRPVERPADWRPGLRLTLLDQENQGPGTARNLGAARASGEYVAFTDDDCEPEPRWLEALSEAFRSCPDAAVGGATFNALTSNPYADASQLLVDSLYEHYDLGGASARFVTSNNFACPTRLFREVGGFHPGFRRAAAEDREFCDRWLRMGYALIQAPEARVAHRHHLTLGRFLRQHFHYGMGAHTFHRIRQESAQEKPAFESFGFYWRILRNPWTRGRGWGRCAGVGLAVLTQAANACGYVAARGGWVADARR